MTTANKITLLRIFLVPVFIGFAVYYGQSVAEGRADERLRWAAVVVFAIASISDGLDGYIARRYNQRSRLGLFLDPLADKLLMVSSLLVLSLAGWPQRLPLWFPIIVISREVLTGAAALVVDRVAGRIEVTPHWTGKWATVWQMIAIGWVMLDLRFIPAIVAAVVAGAFTIISGAINLASALKQLQQSGHAQPEP